MHIADSPIRHPQIKICGLTAPDTAAACAQLGADAIGVVFHPSSPRNVTLEQAAAIAAALPAGVPAVGVFVNPSWELLAAAIAAGRLGAVQLHGTEPPDLIERLKTTYPICVIKALFAARAPQWTAAARYAASAYLVECGRGTLPGGNALVWEWGAAAEFARRNPTLLAGGLEPSNVAGAIAAALPDAVDVSSGVEAAPGRKDLGKVARFIAAVHRTGPCYPPKDRSPRAIFGG